MKSKRYECPEDENHRKNAEMFYLDTYGFIRDELLRIYSLSRSEENKLKALELLIKAAQL